MAADPKRPREQPAEFETSLRRAYFPSETATANKRPNDLLDRDLEASDDAGVAASRE
jgi:hypothetical protein